MDIRKPQCDLRQYRSIRLPNGTRLLLVSDPEATFAAACASVRAGYFDDPDSVPGLAHFLEHAVHLGSAKYPDAKAYKSFLSQHGGTSNASTSMVHTAFHFKVHHNFLEGALDRFAQFFISPLLLREAAMAEVENVHAEYSRNCNSDQRKLLQLRRSCMGPPYSQFSTGNINTLRDAPLQQGLPIHNLLKQYWQRRYTGDSLCCCVVAPQPLDQLEHWAAASFAGVRPTADVDTLTTPTAASLASPLSYASAASGTPAALTPASATVDQTLMEGQVADETGDGMASSALDAAVGPVPVQMSEDQGGLRNGEEWQDWPLDFSRVASPDQLGLMFRVRPQRELRELEVRWYIPYGSMQDSRCKPWRWVGHLLGHEAQGSLAYSLKQAGLVQSLVAGMGDEVRLGRGFMFWGLTLSLTEEGLSHEALLLEAIYAAIKVVKDIPEACRQEIFNELKELSELHFNYQDRQDPLDLAKDAANRLHYFAPEELLSAPSTLQMYDGEAIDRFLSNLVPEAMNVYFSSQHHPAHCTPLKEQWYGAKYSVEPLCQDVVQRLQARLGRQAPSQGSTGAASAQAASTALQPLPLLPLALPAPNWALPVRTELVQISTAASTAASRQPGDQAPAPGHSIGIDGGDGVGGSAGIDGDCAASRSRYVASDLRQRPTGPPELLISSAGLNTWVQTDVSLGLPKVHVYLHIITPEAYRTPRQWVLSRLYCRLVNDLLESQVYYAQLAATSFSLSCTETGLTLHLQGYSSVVPRLLEVVLQGMTGGMLDKEHVQRRFNVHEGQLRQSWQVWRHNNPLSHAEYHADLLLQQPHWHVTKDGLSLLQQGGLGPDDVVQWAATLASGAQLQVDMLAYGNVDHAQGAVLADLVKKHLQPQGLDAEHWPQPRVHQLLLSSDLTHMLQATHGSSTQGSLCVIGSDAAAARLCFQPENPNPANSNSAACYVCQVGEGAPRDVRRSVLLELLVQVASKPCFHALRTVQRLGYTAGCQLHRLHGVLGFVVRVQSANYPASYLRQCITQWLLDFRQELQELPQERLQHFKDSMAERYKEPPKSLGDAAGQAWLPIRRGTLDFDTRTAKASSIGTITHQELLAFYDRCISPVGADHQALCCEVQGKAVPTVVHDPSPNATATSDTVIGTAADTINTIPSKRPRLTLGELPEPSGWSAVEPEPSRERSETTHWVLVNDADLPALQRHLPAYPPQRPVTIGPDKKYCRFVNNVEHTCACEIDGHPASVMTGAVGHSAFSYEAVVLAGGDDKRLFPLSAGVPKALLPVANRPLLHYPLRMLAEAGLRHAWVIVSGDKPTASVSAWLQTEYPTQGQGLQCEVISVPEEYGTADALRAVASKITCSTFVVVSGDLLTDVPVNALLASHQMHGALATVMLCPRKTSPASETKPGKPPKNVDYIGLDAQREQLLFYASSPETLRDLKVPLPIVTRHSTMNISSDLVDAHLYVFNKSLLTTLESQGKLTSLRQDLLPFLTQQQVKLRLPVEQATAATGTGTAAPSGSATQNSSMQRQASAIFDAEGGEGGEASELDFNGRMPGDDFMEMTHGVVGQRGSKAAADAGSSLLRVHVVQTGTNYCARVDDVQAYGDVNREVADPNLALHLSGLRPTKYDNIVAASTTIGNKTTVAAACIVGENGVLGDKSSIKRSVLGNNVKLGINVKVINSVLMDNVVVADNCTIQNSILCSGVQLKERASVKDCQIGPGFVVAGGLEYKSEVLVKGGK